MTSPYPERTGMIDVPGGAIWYRRLGGGGGTPLLLLHGGPGVGSDCFRPLDPLAQERPLIFYDQLGGGNSTHDLDRRYWTVEKYVSDVGAVRDALELDAVHILGHSWGTQLAAEYLRTRPTGVKSVIFASPSLNTLRWAEDMKVLLAQMPDGHREAIEDALETGKTDTPDYHKAMNVFSQRHMARRMPWSEDLIQSSKTANLELYHGMWGDTDFAATGVVKDMNSEDVLPSLSMPVLFTTGRYDGARPETCAHYQSLTPGARLHIFEESAHVTMHDEPEESCRVIGDFLRRVDEG